MTNVDTEFVFNIKKAENGDIDAICAVIDRYCKMEAKRYDILKGLYNLSQKFAKKNIIRLQVMRLLINSCWRLSPSNIIMTKILNWLLNGSKRNWIIIDI